MSNSGHKPGIRERRDGAVSTRVGRDVRRSVPTIGLALGGGGARGLAHILALEVFDEMGLRPTVIAGTSIGAIFGAAYASGMTGAQIRARTEDVLSRRLELLRPLFRAQRVPLQKVLSIFHLRSAFLKPEALLDLVLPPGVKGNIEDLEIPLYVVATDFSDQSEIVFNQGSVRRAVAASIAVPALFTPVFENERLLVDGGLVNPLPFDLLSKQTDITIAIDVSGDPGPVVNGKSVSALKSLVGAFQILQNSIVREKLRSRRPDILIELEVEKFHVLDFLKFKEILEAAEPAKEELRAKLTRVLGAQTVESAGDDDDTDVSVGDDKLGNRRKRLADRLIGGA